MAVLPNDPFSLNNVSVQSQPGLTWYIDQAAGRISGEVDGYDAVRQAVEIILRTERFKWFIYEPSSGVEYESLIGLDLNYVAVELQRRIREALSMDSRVLGIHNYTVTTNDSNLIASFVVDTVFGEVAEEVIL